MEKKENKDLNSVFNFVKLLDEKKATDILIIGISKVAGIGDYFVIATAQNAIHARALADFIEVEQSKLGREVLRRDGVNEGRWIVLDYGDIIIHIFVEELRLFYQLEKLWGEGKNIIKMADIERERENQRKANFKQEQAAVKAEEKKAEKEKKENAKQVKSEAKAKPAKAEAKARQAKPKSEAKQSMPDTKATKDISKPAKPGVKAAKVKLRKGEASMDVAGDKLAAENREKKSKHTSVKKVS